MSLELILADTTPEAAAVQREIYRRMPPRRRLEMAFQLSDFVRGLVADGVRARHPDYDEQKVGLAVARLTLGGALFQKVYPGVEVDV